MSSHQFMSGELARLKQENEQLRDQVVRYREFIATLLELDREALRARSSDQLLHLLARILTDALAIVEVEDGSLALLDEEASELTFVIVRGQVAPQLKGYRIPAGEGVAGWVVQHRQPTIVLNARLDERFSQRIDEQTGFHTHSILAVPLVGDEHVLGVVEAINKTGSEPFDETDKALIWLFCRFAGEALSMLERELEDNGEEDEA
jgi:GAF domain-containing protein